MSRASASTSLTPPEVARRYRISAEKVLAWIRSGELRAINVATRTSGRPRYRITAEGLADFEERRAAQATPQRQATRRCRAADDVIEFF